MTDPKTLKRSARPPVAIIGGGAIGLGIGWRLAQAGVPVDIFERGEAGHGASWAAAGMLAAGVETEPGEAALAALNRASLALWPDFAAELEAASGVSVELRREGTLQIALNRDDAAQLRFTYDFQRAHGVALEWLSPKQALEREPRLNPALSAAVFSPGDHQADNRFLVRALKRAFLAAGGKLHEHVRVRPLKSPTAASPVSALMGRWWLPTGWYSPPALGRARSPVCPRARGHWCVRSKGRCWLCAWIRRRRSCATWYGRPKSIWCHGATAG